jgi:hypothetical protein
LTGYGPVATALVAATVLARRKTLERAPTERKARAQ